MTNLPFERSKIENKLNSISFRGPDNLGVSKVNSISLGHVRLAVLDLDKRSNQPYIFNQYHIVYNGEIYNFKSIQQELEMKGHVFDTASDTEILLKGYAEWGKDVLNKLNGMFAFAIYDSKNDEVFCARDRLGVKPFYYYWKDSNFEICSQLSPLIEKNSEISEEAVSIYLDCGYVPSPYSIIKNIFKLQPGCFMKIKISAGTKEIKHFWNLDTIYNYKDIEYRDAVKQTHSLLKDAVSIRLQSDVPVGCFLSGGIDSALVVALASKLSDRTIDTFSVGFEDSKFDESKIAKKYSEILGTNQTEIICKPSEILDMLPVLFKVYDEPFADSSALPSLLLNKLTKQYVTVALSGDGGDESFLGYTHFDIINKFNKFQKIPFPLRKSANLLPWHKLLGKKRPTTISGMLQCKDTDDVAWGIFTGFDSIQKTRYTEWGKHFSDYKYWAKDPIQKTADLNIKLWLENDSNVKVDRASMAFSMEVRSPFLDYRVVEFARKLPINYRYQPNNRKRILRDILSDYIPEEIFNQPKKGFSIPLNKWIKNELKSEILSVLNHEELTKIPNLDAEKIKQQLNDTLSGKYDYSEIIWRIFIFIKWKNEFLPKR